MCRALNCSQQSLSATLHEMGLPGGPRRINQLENFDIEGLEPSISKLTLWYQYMIWPSILKILQYQYMNLSFDIEESLILNTTDIEEKASTWSLHQRIFDIGCFDIEVPAATFNIELQYQSFFISVWFNIEACRLRYRSTDLLYRSYILYPI